MSETFDYLASFARFPFSLRRFLKHPLTHAEAVAIARRRLETRAELLLGILERSVYGHARSPYRAMLKHAGIEQGDVARLLKELGVEQTLGALRHAGVYVSYEEFKGRVPLVRPGLELAVKPRDFDNPYAGPELHATTGGSTGLGTHISHSLDHMAAASHHQRLMLDAYHMAGAPGVVWLPILPATGLTFVLRRTHLREPNTHWFSFLGWRDSSHWLRYDAALWYMLFWLRVFDAQVPTPEIVRSDEAILVARAIRKLLDTEGRCMFYSSVSQTLRVCLAAEAAGFDLKGSAVRLTGEPSTPAKVEIVRRVGMLPIPNYGSVETGPISAACLNGIGADDTHLWTDSFALITHPFTVPGAGITVPAFNLTTLLAESPKVMLNYQSDDWGIVETRTCGCELESYGYTTHVREIRSYSKLVGEGITLIANEFVPILEQVLPARFGGSPLDYQLLEQEDGQGFTRLFLLIHPRLEIENEQAVIDTVFGALRQSSGMADVAQLVWQQAQTLQVKRQVPIMTARGKISPLHLEHNARP